VLERGEIELKFECQSGSLAIFYHEHRFPLDPHDYPRILEKALAIAPRDRVSENERAELESLTAAFAHLPDRRNPSSEAINERNRDKELHKRRLAELCARNSALSEAIASATNAFMGREGDASSFDALHELLESQAFRLAYWRVASDEINYRRFFDVNDLAALRMENDTVFEATHRNVLDLIAAGKIDGLRIDHPDGLYHPAQYFRRLQQRAGAAMFASVNGADDLPLYLLIEKITASFERLPSDWPVHGTTGYNFANMVNGLFVDGGSKLRFDRLYRTFIGEHLEWENTVFDAKLRIVRTSLAAELNVLANQLVRIARAERNTRDFTLNSLRQALAEVIACFPVYRTYVAESVSNEDRRYIDWALASAKRRGAATELAVFDFVRDVLLGDGTAGLPALREAARAFAGKFQQVTSPVTAKGVEDTAHYRFNRLVSLNEVGGEPNTFGTSVRAFHADSQYRAKHWPHEMLSTSTHDTKRSEDVRARINVLSEMVNDWREALERWSRINRSRKREVEELPAPSANDEYLLYQTLIGTLPLEDAPDEWPQYIERIEAYMIKAVREAKQHSSWSNVNEEYEEAVKQFVRGVLDPRDGNLFIADFVPTTRRIARYGLFNGLSQTLCKLTAPGVPDIYQGNELWDFSLVDPDNRRPVDYEKRSAWLKQMKAAADKATKGQGTGDQSASAVRIDTPAAQFARSLLDTLTDGRAKLFVTAKALQLRQDHEDLFRNGDYLPLRVTGEHANRLCAYARRRGQDIAIALAPRLYRRLLVDREIHPLGAEVWTDTAVELPRVFANTPLTNLFDGNPLIAHDQDGRSALRVAEALSNFPVALFTTHRR
jgi:(1->4)-alpha-D-glucan 1-alpha-D-glucosylmutase